MSTVQHDNVAFRFATYLHVKGVAKQEAVGSRVLFVEKNRSIDERGKKKKKGKRKRKKKRKCFKMFRTIV